jgi:tRNA1Val (adenine37-N6)-methyltransferase
LLALMAAQRSSASIEAVELNGESAEEAQHNVSNSPWSNRIKVICCRIQDYSTIEKFDCIISNPPFYKNSLRSENQKRNQVMQQDALGFHELAYCISKLLTNEGTSWLLLPEIEMRDFILEAKQNKLFLKEKILLRNKTGDAPIRWICSFSFKEMTPTESELTIYSTHQVYTTEFIQLLKPYYLKL